MTEDDAFLAAIWHRQIADDLRGQIERGELRPGDPLPAERKLAADQGVARETVRRALQKLEHEGLVLNPGPPYPRTVAERKLYEVHLIRTPDRTHPGESPTRGADSFMGDMIAAGLEPEQHPVVNVHETASTEVARRLGIGPGDWVVSRRLLRWAGGRPHNLATYWFPVAIVRGTPLDQKESVTEGTIPWLERNRGPVEHDPVRLTWRAPAQAELDELRIPPGWNVAIMWRVARNPAGPVMASMTVLPGDRTELVGP